MKRIGKVLWTMVKVYVVFDVLTWAFIGLSEAARLITVNDKFVRKYGYVRSANALYKRACKRFRDFKEYVES